MTYTTDIQQALFAPFVDEVPVKSRNHTTLLDRPFDELTLQQWRQLKESGLTQKMSKVTVIRS